MRRKEPPWSLLGSGKWRTRRQGNWLIGIRMRQNDAYLRRCLIDFMSWRLENYDISSMMLSAYLFLGYTRPPISRQLCTFPLYLLFDHDQTLCRCYKTSEGLPVLDFEADDVLSIGLFWPRAESVCGVLFPSFSVGLSELQFASASTHVKKLPSILHLRAQNLCLF